MSKIIMLHRKPTENAFSIEGIFSRLCKCGLSDYISNVMCVPFSGASIKNMVSNMLYVRQLKANEIHITGDIHYAALLSKSKTILTIHDVKSIVSGNIVSRAVKYLFWILLPVLKYKKITCISDFTYNELTRIVPKFTHSKVSVIRNPINLDIFKAPVKGTDLDLPSKYILHIGTKSNKNLTVSIKAVSKTQLPLVIVGQLCADDIKQIKDSNIVWKNYHNLEFSEIVFLYQRAYIVSFMSLYEGFGMPILEAQAAGVPVVTSDRQPMVEVVGKGGLAVDPLNIDMITKSYQYLEDDSLRNRLIELGYENAQKYDEKRVLLEYIRLYESLITI